MAKIQESKRSLLPQNDWQSQLGGEPPDAPVSELAWEQHKWLNRKTDDKKYDFVSRRQRRRMRARCRDSEPE